MKENPMDLMFAAHENGHERNSCQVCRWRETAMCPKDAEFVGRQLNNIYRDPICHRFMITKDEELTRQELVLEKLHQNLGAL